MTEPLTTEDRVALADLAARYAVAVDAREFERLREVFTPEARLDTGRSERVGIEQIIEAMGGLRRYTATTHVVGQQVVDPFDGFVTGITYCSAHHLSGPPGEQTDKVMHIQYHDRFVRVDGGWRIEERRLDVRWTDEQPVG